MAAAQQELRAALQAAAPASAGGDAAAGAAAGEWQQKYEALLALRMTEPEEQLAGALARAAARDSAQTKLIEHLQAQLAAAPAPDAAPAANAAAAAAPSAASASAPAAAARIAALESTLAQFAALTGLQLEVAPAEDGSGDAVVSCTARNAAARRAVKFELRTPAGGAGEVEYTPVANAHMLPEYMRDELAFGAEQCPMFIAKVVNALHASSS